MRTRMWAGGGRSIFLAIGVLSLLGLASPVAAGGEVASGVDLKFWGRAVFNMQYDTAIQAVDFNSYITDDENEEVNFNPRDTRLGFRASSEAGDWRYSATFEMDFYGSNAGNSFLPRLRLGYAEAKNNKGLSIRGGQDWTPVARQNPGAIDFGILAWSGNLWWRVPQFTVRYRPGNVELLGSVMKHRNSNAQEMQEKLPWVLGRVGASDLIGAGSHVALGGGFRLARDVTFSATGSDAVSTGDYDSYLVAGELVLPLGSRLVLNGEAFYGQGIGREWVHYGLDYNPWHPDGPREIQTVGGFASLKIPATDRTTFNVGYGLTDPTDEDLVDSAAPFLRNHSVFANFKFAVTKNFGWGIEATHMMTRVEDEGGSCDLSGQRFTGSWQFVF